MASPRVTHPIRWTFAPKPEAPEGLDRVPKAPPPPPHQPLTGVPLCALSTPTGQWVMYAAKDGALLMVDGDRRVSVRSPGAAPGWDIYPVYGWRHQEDQLDDVRRVLWSHHGLVLPDTARIALAVTQARHAFRDATARLPLTCPRMS